MQNITITLTSPSRDAVIAFILACSIYNHNKVAEKLQNLIFQI